jgi:hypothetical protein
MFAEPTEADFIVQLEEVGREAGASLGAAIGRILAENSNAGRLRSGLTVKLILREASANFDSGCNAMLRVLLQFCEGTAIDQKNLRAIAELRIRALGDVVIYAAQQPLNLLDLGNAAQSAVDERIAEIRGMMDRRLRHFDIGMWRDRSASGGAMTSNTVNAETIIGGVQQGSHRSSMSVSNTLDAVTIGVTAKALRAALDGCDDNQSVRELRGDLDTIQAQLSKASPVRAILAATGKSVRAILENVVAGMLTPEAIAAATVLAASLGA